MNQSSEQLERLVHAANALCRGISTDASLVLAADLEDALQPFVELQRKLEVKA